MKLPLRGTDGMSKIEKDERKAHFIRMINEAIKKRENEEKNKNGGAKSSKTNK